MNTGKGFGLAQLENKLIWTLKELTHTGNIDLNKLLDLYGETDKNKSISIDAKFQEVRSVPLLAGLIADSENIPVLPNGKEGFYRRFIFIESRSFTEAVNHLSIVEEFREDIFCWLISQEVSTAMTLCNLAKDNPNFKAKALEVQKENSNLGAFVDECFDVNNDSQTEYTQKELLDLHTHWAEVNNEKTYSTRIFSRFLKKALKMVGWTEKIRESNSKTFYSGFKLKTDDYRGSY